jgi:hypothetical protein
MAVTVTGIFFVIWGVLVTLFGVLFLAIGQAGGAFEEFMPGTGAAVAGVITVLAIFVLALGILTLASGIGVFMSKVWARIIGIIMGVIWLLLGGLILLGSLGSDSQSDAGGIVIFGIVAALSAVAVWALVAAGPYFAYRR